MDNIRNFVIIAHIDHGKSTLADRLLEITGTIEKRLMKPQYLDQLELERERGITIKMAPVRMKYAPQNDADGTQNNAEDFLYKDLTYKIRGLLFQVRKKLGLGHKEQIYHNAIEIELKNAGLSFESKKNIPILYEEKKIGIYQPDFVVEGKVIVELKALPEISKPQIEQIWSYLKGCEFKLALLVNFGSKDLEIKRIIYDKARSGYFLRDSASSLRESAGVSNQTENNEYILNLIDTPGHSDFAYEVSRALAAVEGAVLLVDATQGIQAQTLANFENARRQNLTIIGAVNKIDVATTEQIEAAVKDLGNLLEAPAEEILKVSGKTGEGVPELLEAIIKRIPSPNNSLTDLPNNSKALIFDSFYDEHKGIIAFVRVFSGRFLLNQNLYLAAAKKEFKVKELGYFAPQLRPGESLNQGEIGFIATGIKDPDVLKIGDTIIGVDRRFDPRESASLALPGYKEPMPVVFVSFYPEDTNKYEEFKQALAKLRLTDAALKFEPDFSEVLGRGFKGGFLGRLHFEITAERLEREFRVFTAHSFPSVAYRVRTSAHTRIDVDNNANKRGRNISDDLRLDPRESAFVIVTNPKDFPSDYLEVQEPMTKIEIVAPPQFLGAIMQLKEIFRFSDSKTKTLNNKVVFAAKLPLADLIRDLDDKLKSVSQGFASFHYEIIGYEKAEVEKLEVLVAGHLVSGLTRILPKKDIEREARITVEKLKELLPKQLFVQPVQAVAGGRIIARETIPAFKKLLGNFGKTGGDRTRKMKL